MKILDISLTYAGLLWLLIPILVGVWYLYRRNTHTQFFSGFTELRQIYGHHAWWYRLQFVFIFLILFAFVILFTFPVKEQISEKTYKDGVDIEILLDVSYSMMAEDLAPNRLAVAKEVIHNFVSEQVSNRVGLVVFSGRPFSSLPLTFDYKIIEKIVSRISTDIINQERTNLQGTAIGDAMMLGMDNLEKKDTEENATREKVMILMTDGEANKGVDPMIALKAVKEAGIKVYTIGIGGQEPSYVTVDTFGLPQRLQVGGVDEETLRQIASETGGKYYRATDEQEMQQIFEDISKLETGRIEVESIHTNVPIYLPIVYFLLFCMLGYMGLLVWKRM